MSNSATPWTVACQAPLSSTVSWSLLKFMSIELVVLSNHLILYFPLLLLTSIFPNIRVFSNVLALRIRRPKYRSFSFSIRPSNELGKEYIKSAYCHPAYLTYMQSISGKMPGWMKHKL